jgi:RNA polymerase sigma factor (sigma-70 family)
MQLTTEEAATSLPFESDLEAAIPFGYRLACGMLHDPAAAEDAVQEASLKAWRKRSTFRPGADLRPWFLAIVANECRSALRGRWRSVLTLERWVPAPATTRGDAAEGADLRRELRRLSPGDRAIVVAFFYLDLPLDEVARMAGVSPSAARSRLYRSIKRLRPGLEIEEAVR